MTDIDIAAIEARVAAATEGPWVHPYEGCRDIRGGDDEYVVDSFNDGVGAGVIEQVDAEFIAHARTDVPALVACVRELEATIERVRDRVDSVMATDDLDPDGYQVAGLISSVLNPREGT